MIWRQVGIAHGHSETGVAKDFLQSDYVPAILYGATIEGMPQDMASLPFCQLYS